MGRGNNSGYNRKKKRSWAKWVLLLLIIVAGTAAFIAYKVFGSGTAFAGDSKVLYITSGSTYNKVLSDLNSGNFIKDRSIFDQLAKQAHLPQNIHPGKYRIKSSTSYYNLIRKLRSGRQEPVKLVINKFRTKEDIAGFISSKLEADSAELIALMYDPKYLSEFGLDTSSVTAAFIPDTYEFFWSTDADKAFRRLEEYKQKYWNKDRLTKAKQLGLSPEEVTTIASIIEEETNINSDKPKIASVYLNRLKYHIPLQADPTVKYAMRDFGLKRILNVHLDYKSPYNTYLVQGLPPGPICTPSKTSIEAVLNAPDTDYLYFCAKADFSGYHAFASTLTEHQKNARAFHRAMNERGIK